MAQIAVLVAGSLRRDRSGRLTTADLWLFYGYAVLLTFPTFLMGFVVNIAMRALAGLERLGEILDTVPSIRDRDDALALDEIRGDVEIKGADPTALPAARSSPHCRTCASGPRRGRPWAS